MFKWNLANIFSLNKLKRLKGFWISMLFCIIWYSVNYSWCFESHCLDLLIEDACKYILTNYKIGNADDFYYNAASLAIVGCSTATRVKMLNHL